MLFGGGSAQQGARLSGLIPAWSEQWPPPRPARPSSIFSLSLARSSLISRDRSCSSSSSAGWESRYSIASLRTLMHPPEGRELRRETRRESSTDGKSESESERACAVLLDLRVHAVEGSV